MVFVDIRITLETAQQCSTLWKVQDQVVAEPEPHQNPVVIEIHNYLLRKNKKNHDVLCFPKITDVKYIWVKEKFNKYGEITKTHYHLNWWLPDLGIKFSQDTFRKWLNDCMGLKGSAVYCMRCHTDIGDTDRWWRYCCKQIRPLAFQGFTDIEIDEYHKLGNDEWEQRKIEKIAMREKLENKNNFRNKLIKHMLKQHKEKPYIMDRDIFCDICRYYKKQHQTCPFKKLDDLVVDIKCEIGMLTYEEYYDNTH